MASKAVQKILEWRKENLAKLPSLGGELAAIAREAVNDIRSTAHEVYFGKPESPAGPGTPMSPTQFQINNDLEVQKDTEPDMEM